MVLKENRLSCLVVEDEIYDRKAIEHILSSYDDLVKVIGSVGTKAEAIDFAAKHKPQLIFLDIELHGNRNGAFEILEQLAYDYKVIFVTAKNEKDDLLKAIKLSCIDYLIKPTKVSDFKKPILNARQNIYPQNEQASELKVNLANLMNGNSPKLSLQTGYSYKPVAVKDIIRCKANGNYTDFYCTVGELPLVLGNLKSFENRLKDYGFFRIGRNDLINLREIETFTKRNTTWEIVMMDGCILHIAPNKKNEFMSAYHSCHSI